MNRTVYFFPAMLFTIVTLLGAVCALDGNASETTWMGLGVTTLLTVFFWHRWWRAGLSAPRERPHLLDGRRIRMSKKERRTASREKNL